jgi:hypothetical protein
MAESLTAVIRLRKRVLDNLYRQLKKVDNKMEISERFLKRIRARKRVVPDVADIQYLTNELKGIVDLLAGYERLVRQGFAA